jgi:hypothetical protein
MCDFISGVINRTTCEVKFYDGRSHSALFEALKLHHKNWAEWEWTKEDDGKALDVRTHDSLPGNNAKQLKASLLSQFPTRSDAVARFVKTLDKRITTLYLNGATISTALTIPDSVTTLDLNGATISTALTIPDSVTTLDLSYATISTALTIPDSVTTLRLYRTKGRELLTISKRTKVID